MKKTTEIKYTLNEREFNLVKKCVDFSYHRATKHREKVAGILKTMREVDLKQLKGDIDKYVCEMADYERNEVNDYVDREMDKFMKGFDPKLPKDWDKFRVAEKKDYNSKY